MWLLLGAGYLLQRVRTNLSGLLWTGLCMRVRVTEGRLRVLEMRNCEERGVM